MNRNCIHTFTRSTTSIAAAVTLALAATSAHAISFDVPGTGTKLDVGGYVKLDVIYNDHSAGNNNQNNIEFSPNGIPLENTGEEDEANFVMNGRESRLWVKTETPTDGGPLKTHLELDFDTNTGNQAVSNSHAGRIRHAYGTYGNWLLGRTWSAFMYLPGLPETNDFGGPTGDIFVRQAQFRYTHPLAGGGNLVVSFENPETAFVPAGGSLTVVDDDTAPDVVVRYNASSWSVAALMRQLNVEEGAVDESATALAIQLGWSLGLGNGDKFQGIISAGDGIGRYGSLLGHPDAYIDNSGGLEALSTVQGFIAYQHKWSQDTRTNIVLGYTKADDPSELAASDFNDNSQSLHVNWMWDQTKQLRHGIELIHGERETYSNKDGELNRVQWSSRFMF